MANVDILLNVARAEIGYIEKRTNANLDSKTANAGTSNWTKYARDLANIPGWYDGNKNGYAWCDVFVDWCFVKAFGAEKAKKLLNNGPYGAGCTSSANYYKRMGRFHTKNPHPGDQIFYGKLGSECHTGIVESVTSTTVVTIEGNTSNGNTTNGDRVDRKSRSINDAWIVGYGTPNWSVLGEVETVTSVSTNRYTVQSGDTLWLIGKKVGVSYLDIAKANNMKPPYVIFKGQVLKIPTVNGTTGSNNTVPKKATNSICTVTLPVLSKDSVGPGVKALQSVLKFYGFYTSNVDGYFGDGTESAVLKFQGSKKLKADGIVGVGTWTALIKG